MTDERIRVVLADDHRPIRDRIRAALEAGGCEIVGEGANADDAVALTLAFRPDVVLLDIHMPGNGIRAAERIAREVPGTPVVMLTLSRDDDDLFESLRAGATGYLLKDTSPAALPAALHRVLAGEAAIPPALVARVLQHFRASPPRLLRRSGPAEKLSEREREVMELLGQGRSTEEVAKQLFLSPTTVRVHVSSVLRKLAVKDRESAISLLRQPSNPPPRSER
ncbi:response regulator transcription factor [Naasia sp. SYSU D00057]|uniref:response regulator transcription factor n=1 Tax=Naasia sp. SYSU D00057 TaxID=2817380 RepID=UPI0027DC5BF9|nr:response regulator transcription factor [Naasia sp. SYSU D00057]